jgi:hypothetical protein
MPFRDPDRSHDLATRIELEVRERLEDAIDHVCLQALVQRRRSTGDAAPEPDNPADRAEYEAHVLAFLRLLARDLTAGVDRDTQRIAQAAGADARDESSRLVGHQVVLARRLPDYWQRFEVVSARYLDAPHASGGAGGGMLRRLFGGG